MKRRARRGWVYDSDSFALDFYRDDGAWIYDVTLARCRTAAGMLDTIFQVAAKTWADDAVIAGLVRELDRRLRPQFTLCAWGRDSDQLDIAATVQDVADQDRIVQQIVAKWSHDSEAWLTSSSAAHRRADA